MGEIFRELQDRGYGPNEECVSVARAGLDFLGRRYERHFRLTSKSIDCSTLVSQAHWLGAATQIPYIAETQRLCTSAINIEDASAALPGDVFVRYPAVSAAPDRKHNHVALAIGWDRKGGFWLAESRAGRRACLVPASAFPIGGGIRRFCENPRVIFEGHAVAAAAELAARVDKQGRVGAARLPPECKGAGRRRGIHISAATGAAFRTPICGRVEVDREVGTRSLRIVGRRSYAYCLIEGCEPCVADGSFVLAGERVGAVLADPHAAEQPLVYCEVGFRREPDFRLVNSDDAPRTHYILNGNYHCVNWIYLVKLGRVQSPIAVNRRSAHAPVRDRTPG